MNRIYGIHDEAKDKAFELEMSWVCDESNRQHQKVIILESYCLRLLIMLKSSVASFFRFGYFEHALS